MIGSKGLMLATGLLLLTLGTIIVGNKMRGNSAPVVASVPTPNTADGRVAGFDDDPVVIYCKPSASRIEIYRHVNKDLRYLYSFDMSSVLEAAPQSLTVQATPNVTLTLAKERLGRYFLSFQQQDDPKQVVYFGKYFIC